jgi:hypothetical protein
MSGLYSPILAQAGFANKNNKRLPAPTSYWYSAATGVVNLSVVITDFNEVIKWTN